jgi:hypothetical protein
MGAPPLSLRAVIFPEEREWVAHCRDLDLVETGATPEAAMDALAAAVSTQLWYARSHDNVEHLFQPAPQDAWRRLWRRSSSFRSKTRCIAGEALV